MSQGGVSNVTDYVTNTAFPSLSTASISYNNTNGTANATYITVTGAANVTYLNTTATQQLGQQGMLDYVVDIR